MKDSGRLQGRQQRFRRHMAGEQRSELQSQTIITHSVDAVSESQRRDLQSHHNSCKRSELQPSLHRTAYCRDGHEKVRSTEQGGCRKKSPTGTAGERCVSLVFQLTSST